MIFLCICANETSLQFWHDEEFSLYFTLIERKPTSFIIFTMEGDTANSLINNLLEWPQNFREMFIKMMTDFLTFWSMRKMTLTNSTVLSTIHSVTHFFTSFITSPHGNKLLFHNYSCNDYSSRNISTFEGMWHLRKVPTSCK